VTRRAFLAEATLVSLGDGLRARLEAIGRESGTTITTRRSSTDPPAAERRRARRVVEPGPRNPGTSFDVFQ
jgi:hypothetical protein